VPPVGVLASTAVRFWVTEQPEPASASGAVSELISLIGSVRLREEVARGKGAMRLQSRSGDDHRAGFI
jgi:hypothetical protein